MIVNKKNRQFDLFGSIKCLLKCKETDYLIYRDYTPDGVNTFHLGVLSIK